MNVVKIFPAFVIGGAESMCENFIYELRALGCDVIVH